MANKLEQLEKNEQKPQRIADAAASMYNLRKADSEAAQYMPLHKITVDQSLQIRVNGIDAKHRDKLLNVIENGGELDPIDVFKLDDGRIVVTNGFHRLDATRKSGMPDISCIVHEGTYEDAQNFAEEANLQNGLTLQEADLKRLLFNRLER